MSIRGIRVRANSVVICLLDTHPAASPGDLLDEGGRFGVFVILDGGGTILAFAGQIDEHRDEFVLALRLDGEAAVRVVGDDPTVVEAAVLVP